MKVVLDACVLLPSVLREILLGVAAHGSFTPVWSSRILGEWQRATTRLGPDASAIAAREIAHLRACWPKAEVPADPGVEARLWLPDPADVHVLSTAVCGDANVIVTLNLRDFPARILSPEKVSAVAPDDFLMARWLDHPAAVEAAVMQAQRKTAEVSGRPQPLRPLLKRAKLPRLGKALG